MSKDRDPAGKDGLLGRLLRMAMSRGWRRGIGDGNRAWAVVGGVALATHLARRILRRDEETVIRELLRPGESFVVTNLPKR